MEFGELAPNPKAEAKKTYDAMNKKLTITNEYEKKKLKERGDYSRTEAARKDVNDRNNKVKQTTKKIGNAIAKAKHKIVGLKKERPKAVITSSTNLFNFKPVKKRKSGRQK